MQTSCKRIGVLGGTFNPIHNGHLEIAGAVRKAYRLDKVLFIPSGMPPHKTRTEVIGAEHRLAMVRRAISGEPYFEVSEMEINRSGYSYTVDTPGQLRQIYGPDCTIYFIIGADIIPELITWREASRVFSLCEFIAVLRPGHTRQEFLTEIEKLRTDYKASINTADAQMPDISSTQIRELIKENKPITGLVPKCVEKYVIENRLYKDN